VLAGLLLVLAVCGRRTAERGREPPPMTVTS
jgi:hypothetical protein